MNEDEKNIYLEALQFGYKNISTGITVWELFKHLTQDGKFDIQIEGDEEAQKRSAERAQDDPPRSIYRVFRGEVGNVFSQMILDWFTRPNVKGKTFLNIQAIQFYIELIELREAREEARKAERHANRALYVAIVGIFLGVFGAVDPYFNFIPPQKVEIINKQLEPIYPITPSVALTAQNSPKTTPQNDKKLQRYQQMCLL